MKYSKTQWIIFILIVFTVVIFTFVGLVSLSSINYSQPKNFTELDVCHTDADCILGQANAGPDLPSPEPRCVSRAVIDGKYWYESFRNSSYYTCGCNMTSNTCISVNIKPFLERSNIAINGSNGYLVLEYKDYMGPLDSKGFKLYINENLEDDDGCEQGGEINPRDTCNLTFNTTLYYLDVLMVTYNNEEVFRESV